MASFPRSALPLRYPPTPPLRDSDAEMNLESTDLDKRPNPSFKQTLATSYFPSSNVSKTCGPYRHQARDEHVRGRGYPSSGGATGGAFPFCQQPPLAGFAATTAQERYWYAQQDCARSPNLYQHGGGGWQWRQPYIQPTPSPEPQIHSRWYAHQYQPDVQQTQPLTQPSRWIAHEQQVPHFNPTAPTFTPLNPPQQQQQQQQQFESVSTSLLRRIGGKRGVDKHARYSKPNNGGKAAANTNAPSSKHNQKQKLARQAQPVQHHGPGGNHTDKLQFLMRRPTPATQYLLHAAQDPIQLSNPRPLLVVLDLNGALLYRKKRGSNAFVARPHVQEFLDYLFSNHMVMVWSSAKPHNVAQMCTELFTKDQHDQLVAIWGRDRLGLTPEQYNQRVQIYKQLSWIWAEPSLGNLGKWDQRNTVLIDDSTEKAASEPHNLIEIDEFNGVPTKTDADLLDQVSQYLDVLRSQQDVSAYIHSQPFRYTDKDSESNEHTTDSSVDAEETGGVH